MEHLLKILCIISFIILLASCKSLKHLDYTDQKPKEVYVLRVYEYDCIIATNSITITSSLSIAELKSKPNIESCSNPTVTYSLYMALYEDSTIVYLRDEKKKKKKKKKSLKNSSKKLPLKNIYIGKYTNEENKIVITFNKNIKKKSIENFKKDRPLTFLGTKSDDKIILNEHIFYDKKSNGYRTISIGNFLNNYTFKQLKLSEIDNKKEISLLNEKYLNRILPLLK